MIPTGSHEPWTTLSADEALPRLMEAYGPLVRSICLRTCGDEDLADDLAQETFIRAYRSWDTFEGRSKVSTWLYTIARRTAFRGLRTGADEPRDFEDLDPLVDRVPSTAAVPDVDYAAEDPLEHLIDVEEAGLLRAAIGHLPIRYRLPLVLKEMVGLSVDDAADVLHLTEGTLKSRLFRARALLQDAGADPEEMHASLRTGSGPRRSDSLCSKCRPVFQSESHASRLCAEILDGGEIPDLHDVVRRAIARPARRAGRPPTS